MSKAKECPRCSESYDPPFAALSRRDNKTDICPACGTSEAMEDFTGVKYDGKVYWQERYEYGVSLDEEVSDG